MVDHAITAVDLIRAPRIHIGSYNVKGQWTGAMTGTVDTDNKQGPYVATLRGQPLRGH
jgi:hypothetical protein